MRRRADTLIAVLFSPSTTSENHWPVHAAVKSEGSERNEEQITYHPRCLVYFVGSAFTFCSTQSILFRMVDPLTSSVPT